MTTTESVHERLSKIWKLAFNTFVYLLAALGAALTLIIVFAPRPEYGYPASHPLTIATWLVLGTATAVFVLYAVVAVLGTIAGWCVDIVRWTLHGSPDAATAPRTRVTGEPS